MSKLRKAMPEKKKTSDRRNARIAPGTTDVARGTKASSEQKALQKLNAPSDLDKTKSRVELTKKVRRAVARMYGVQDDKLATLLINQAMQVRDVWSSSTVGNGLETALTMLLEMQPKSLTETLLAVQMLGVHAAAMTSLQRAAFARASSDVPDVHMTKAGALMRLFLEQVEAIQKLKGKTRQQKVTVEHVHVNAGGQAIVGAVTAARTKGTGGAKQEGESDENRTKTPSKATGMVEKRESAR